MGNCAGDERRGGDEQGRTTGHQHGASWQTGIPGSIVPAAVLLLCRAMRWTVVWVVLVALILIPFFLFEDWFNALAVQIASGTTSRRAAAALVAGLLTFDVFLPVP